MVSVLSVPVESIGTTRCGAVKCFSKENDFFSRYFNPINNFFLIIKTINFRGDPSLTLARTTILLWTENTRIILCILRASASVLGTKVAWYRIF